MPSTPEPANPIAEEAPGSIAAASLVEIFGALTLVTPTWSILRHPFQFRRYRVQSGAAIHYLYAAIGFATLAAHWALPDTQGMESGGDASPLVDMLNRLIAPIGPHAKLDGTDVLPVTLLFGNLLSGFTAFAACRILARRPAAAPADRNLLAQTMAATAYVGGAISLLFGLSTFVAHGNQSAPASQAAGLVILFLFYCWGRWIRDIHGVVRGRVAGLLFPFGLAFLSLLVFVIAFYAFLGIARALYL